MIGLAITSSGITLDRWAFLYDMRRNPRETDESLRARIVEKHEGICEGCLPK